MPSTPRPALANKQVPKKTGPTSEQIRDLIQHNHIVFEGPRPSSCWPPQFAEIFKQIQEVRHERYQDYRPSETRGISDVEELKSRVRKLNIDAYECRRDRMNESGWRFKIEYKIVSRFEAEVVCPVKACQKRLWISDILAAPHDALDAHRLRMRRVRRTRCECDASLRAAHDSLDPGETRMFGFRAGEPVIHDPADLAANKGLQSLEPDRVFGLGMTKSFERCVSFQPNLRHSPFGDRRLLYPFLVIEAKSEKGSPGFEYIETQTALPLRTCMKLQEDLANSTESNLTPLVWFMAYQGDQWRVYAGTVHDSAYRIYLLWQGTVLSQDDTLQLLQIVDCICDWARDIYRDDVLRCLANGQLDLRDLTPARTVYSSQSDGRRTTPDHAASRISTVVDDHVPTLIDLTDIDEVMPDNVVVGARSSQLSRTDRRHPLLQYSGIGEDSTHWSKYATVRSSNLVLFRFRNTSLPEGRLALSEVLEELIPSETVQKGASLLLDTLLQGAVITTEGLALLEQLWTETDQRRTAREDEPTRACITFGTFFEEDDWQIVRLLSCITCSNAAASQLAMIANRFTQLPARVRRSDAHRCPCLSKAVRDMRNYSGVESATSCILNVQVGLKFTLNADGGRHLCWDRVWDWEESFWPDDLLESPPEVTHSDMLFELLPGKPAPPILRSVSTRDENFEDTDEHSGILLQMRRPGRSRIPVQCPEYCVLVFRDWRYSGGEPWLGEVVAEVVSRRRIMSRPWLRGRDVSDVEIEYLTCWSRILAGDDPPDALSF